MSELWCSDIRTSTLNALCTGMLERCSLIQSRLQNRGHLRGQIAHATHSAVGISAKATGFRPFPRLQRHGSCCKSVKHIRMTHCGPSIRRFSKACFRSSRATPLYNSVFASPIQAVKVLHRVQHVGYSVVSF